MHISRGNSKVGKIPNVSLTPGAGCSPLAPCRSRKTCYAFKALMYPATRANWAANLRQATVDLVGYMIEVGSYVSINKPEFFRWHVGGDILNQSYLDGMKAVARENRATKFLCFTKMHDLDYTRLPPNLTIVFSMWPGWGNTEKKMPRAWMQDGTETRIPADALHCPGACEGCGACWNLRNLNRDVYFSRH